MDTGEPPRAFPVQNACKYTSGIMVNRRTICSRFVLLDEEKMHVSVNTDNLAVDGVEALAHGILVGNDAMGLETTT